MVTAGAARHRGYTLIELVVVLAILAAVTGLGIGVYQKVSTQNILPVAASQVSSVIRAARNYSVSAGLPSRVYIDAREQNITAFGYELVAAWSFEDLQSLDAGDPLPLDRDLLGAFGERASPQGVIEVGDGRIGRGIVLLDEGASLVAPRRPRYDAPRGFSLEAWALFWPRELEKGEGSDRTGAWSDPRRRERYAVISRPGSWEMGLLGDGALYVVVGDAEHPESSDTFAAATGSREVLGNRWTHLRASFDGVELLLEVDGIARKWSPEGFEKVDRRDWPPLPERVPPSEHDLMISHPNRFFYGALDEVKIRIALEPRSYQLPTEVAFLGDSFQLRFDSRGSLDPVYHGSPLLVRIGELGEDAPVDPSSGGTSVAAPTPEEVAALEREEREAAVDGTLGDPVGALSRWLEEQRASEPAAAAAPEGAGPVPAEGEITSFGVQTPASAAGSGPPSPGEGEPDAEAKARGVKRIHRIIVDLTGTIRG